MAVEIKYRSVTIEQAWLNLASDALRLAIEDARQTRDPIKSAKAQRWLMSPAAKLFFESFDFELEVDDWVRAGCPILEEQ